MPIKPSYFSTQAVSTSPLSTGLLFSAILNEGVGKTSIRDLVSGQTYPLEGTTPPTWDTSPNGPLLVGTGNGFVYPNFRPDLDENWSIGLEFRSTNTSAATMFASAYSKYEDRCGFYFAANTNNAGNSGSGTLAAVIKLRNSAGVRSIKRVVAQNNCMGDGVLHRVWVTHDSTNALKMYLDGVLSSQDTIAGKLDLVELVRGVHLLSHTDGYSNVGYAEGFLESTQQVSAFHVYGRTLSLTEIAQLEITPYAMATTISVAPPVPVVGAATGDEYAEYFSISGVPATGLTLAWSTFRRLPLGTDVVSKPVFTEIGGGWYTYNYNVEENGPVVGTIDGGTAADTRYRPVKHLYTLSDESHRTLSMTVAKTFNGPNSTQTTVSLPPSPDNAKIGFIKDVLDVTPGVTSLAVLSSTPSATVQGVFNANQWTGARKVIDRIGAVTGAYGGVSNTSSQDITTERFNLPEDANPSGKIVRVHTPAIKTLTVTQEP